MYTLDKVQQWQWRRAARVNIICKNFVCFRNPGWVGERWLYGRVALGYVAMTEMLAIRAMTILMFLTMKNYSGS